MPAPDERVIAWGDELIKLHDGFRRQLADLRRGVIRTPRELAEHCLAFCDALHAHHTGEDTALFPHLRDHHPELTAALSRLHTEHEAIAVLLARIRALDETSLPTELDRLATELEAHLDYEEAQLVPVLNTMTDLPENA